MSKGEAHMKKIYLFMLFCCTTFLFTSCAFIQESKTAKQIVTTLYPEYDMVKRIIGNQPETKGLFDVMMIIPAGQDSHTYDPSIRHLITIKNADIFIYTADEMETWVGDVDFNKKTKVVNLSQDERIVLYQAEDADHDHEDENQTNHEHTHVHAYDPHYWTYPIYAIYMVEQIKQVMLESIQDPYGTIGAVLEANAKAYIDALFQIDQDIQEVVQQSVSHTMYFGCPFSFYYWSIFYGLDYELTYSTCSTETEPSIATLEHMITEMKEHDVPVIFAKELINQQACEMIQFHTGAEILILHSGHNVSALDFQNEDLSYIQILKENVNHLAKMLRVNQKEGIEHDTTM